MICESCVYYPPNLQRADYSDEEWEELQSVDCSVGAEPGDEVCDEFRTDSCDLVSLRE
ncbi:hypothetical protein ACEU6E_02445 [Halorutilales archaeon Cl-col2-1]